MLIATRHTAGRRLLRLVMSALILMSVLGCTRPSLPIDAIYAAGDIEVYTDSIVINGHEYLPDSVYAAMSVNTNALIDSTESQAAPALRSGSRMADALFALGMSERADTTLTALDIYLAGALLDPQQAMQSLRSMVSNGTVSHPSYPIRAANEAWAAAAWEVYCATGSNAWLKEAYKVINTTYFKEASTLRADGRLIHGLPSYLTPPCDYIPTWMTPVDEYQTVALGTNVWHYATMSVAARMAKLLRLKAEMEWEINATNVRNSINDSFWVPADSHYGQYLYGSYYPVLSPASDNMANPLCVLLGISTPEMSSRLMESRRTLARGMPLVSPSPEGITPAIRPEVQALQGIAASMTGNEQVLLEAVGSLWSLSVTGDGSRQWPALMLRGILGMSLSPDGLKFSPIVPEKLGPTISLTGLRYRDAVLDIHIQGSGDKVASFAVDSAPLDIHMISADTEGHHRVDIVMSGNRLSDEQPQTPVASPANAPAMPNTRWSDERNCKILNFDKNTSYEVYLNGILSECMLSPDYTVTDTGTTVVNIVPVADGLSGFSPRSHVSAPLSARIHIPATAITPRRPPIHLIRDKATASHYIELAARHNTRLTFYVQAPADGEYFLNIGYSNGTSETAMRTVETNDSYSGILVCPVVTTANWVDTGLSSTITVSLRRGVNKLSLTYVNSIILLHDIYLLRK